MAHTSPSHCDAHSLATACLLSATSCLLAPEWKAKCRTQTRTSTFPVCAKLTATVFMWPLHASSVHVRFCRLLFCWDVRVCVCVCVYVRVGWFSTGELGVEALLDVLFEEMALRQKKGKFELVVFENVPLAVSRSQVSNSGLLCFYIWPSWPIQSPY